MIKLNLSIIILYFSTVGGSGLASASNCDELSETFEQKFVENITEEDLRDMNVCSDNPYSAYYLGWALSQDNYKYFNKERAEYYLLKASTLGSTAAKMDLAESYLLGSFTEQDYSKAKDIAKDILKSTKNVNNILFAKYILSYISVTSTASESVIDNDDYENLLIASKAGYRAASDLLLELTFSGKLKGKVNKIYILKLSAKNGNQDAKFSLAYKLYKEGNPDGLHLIFELAHSEYLEAQIFLVNYFDEKNLDDSELYWMKAAADNGSAIMAYYYSNRLDSNNSERLPEEGTSIKYLTFAAENGVDNAYKAIGDYYSFFYCETGESLFYNKALENYKKIPVKIKEKSEFCQ